MDLENLNITFAEGQEKAKHCNTYRLGYSETDIILDFGNLELNDSSREIEGAQVLARIALPVEALQHFLMSLFLIGRKYEEEYKRDIGMSLEGPYSPREEKRESSEEQRIEEEEE